MTIGLRPEDCVKFQSCSCPVCPLDPIPTVHLDGEPVCPYLLATGKAGADERYRDDPVFAVAKERLPALAAEHPPIERAVTRAARYPLRRLNIPVEKRYRHGMEQPSAAGDD